MSKWLTLSVGFLFLAGLSLPIFNDSALAGGFKGGSAFRGDAFSHFPRHGFGVRSFGHFPSHSFGVSRFGPFPRHFHPRTRVFLGFSAVVPLYPSYVYPAPPVYYAPPVYAPPVYAPPVSVADGQIQIEANLPDLEIWVDGRYIGLVRDFAGPAMVSVAPGTHVVEFKMPGRTTSTRVLVNPGAVSVVKVEVASPTGAY